MRDFVSSVSPKGQITLPSELRRQLGIRPKDKVAMRLEGDALMVRPASFTLEDAYGSVTPRNRPENFKEIAAAAKAEHADAAVRKLARQ